MLLVTSVDHTNFHNHPFAHKITIAALRSTKKTEELKDVTKSSPYGLPFPVN